MTEQNMQDPDAAAVLAALTDEEKSKAPPHKHFLVLDPADPQAAFKAHREVNRWALVKAARAEAKKDDAMRAVAFVDLVMAIVLPEERGRLDDYMLDHGDDDGMARMNAAVDAYVNGDTGLPLGPSSTSSTSTTETSPSGEDSSSVPGTLPVKRVDLGTGRVTIEETPQAAIRASVDPRAFPVVLMETTDVGDQVPLEDVTG